MGRGEARKRLREYIIMGGRGGRRSPVRRREIPVNMERRHTGTPVRW
jgi:hypothetical protein